MVKDKLNILCATDDNYVPYCGIMLTSVFENNRKNEVNVYVIIDKPLSTHNENRFRKLSSKYGRKIEYLMIEKSQLSQFPTKGMDYWSIAMYYRIFAEELLPQDIDKIIYLDCDIIVRSSLIPLWNIDLTNKAVGVVSDIFTYFDDIYERLHYPKRTGYFNSGVLLMNLDYWRSHKICKQCLKYLEENYERLFANDQDVLNAVLWDKKVELPISYNYQIQFEKKYFYYKESEALQQEIGRTKGTATIIHYADPIKPWSIMYYRMPYKREWRKYKWKSQWWYLLPILPKRKKINYLIKRFVLWPLGIMYKKEWIE